MRAGPKKIHDSDGQSVAIALSQLDYRKREVALALIDANNNKLIMEAILEEGSTWAVDQLAKKLGFTPARIKAAFQDPVLHDALVRHIYADLVEAAKNSTLRLQEYAEDPETPIGLRISTHKWIVDRHDKMLIVLRQSRMDVNKTLKRVDRESEERIQGVLDRLAHRNQGRKVINAKVMNGLEADWNSELPVPDGQEAEAGRIPPEGESADLPMSEQEDD